MTLHIPAKVLIHNVGITLYYMTLSTEKQRCHVIKLSACYKIWSMLPVLAVR